MATIKAIEARSVHQIQSGQVIVDLCSVVKELVENSLDAEATSVEVRFKNNGLDSIEVQDNGTGIASSNYDTIALKHYTSKLSGYDDLSSLQTFGFRGEAISSLCALSKFSIITAQADEAPKGKRLEFEVSGKLQSTSVVACPKGTTATVEGLFEQLPVRRKELIKNIKREYGKVLGLLHAYACICTHTRFVVKNTMPKGKTMTVFATQSNATTRDNIANVYGAKTLSALVALDLELDVAPAVAHAARDDGHVTKIQLCGHMSRPVFGEGRQAPDRQMFFVNGRPCGLPQIAKAINEVYKSFNVSQSPFIFADFRMDTNAYDVNVAPDKRTILLHDASALTEKLKQSLTELFDRQEHTVPQSHVSGTKLPVYKQLAIPQSPRVGFTSVGLSDETNKNNEQGLNLGERPKSLFYDHFGQQASTRAESRETSRMKASKMERDRGRRADKLANDLATKAEVPEEIGKWDENVESQGDPRADDEDGSRAADAIRVRDFNERMAEHQKRREATRETDMAHARDLVDAIETSAPTAPHKANVIQDAVDRMRPRRRETEVATITIGDKTITTVVGTELSQARAKNPVPKVTQLTSSFAQAASAPRFSSSLRMFGATGTGAAVSLSTGSVSEHGESDPATSTEEEDSISDHAGRTAAVDEDADPSRVQTSSQDESADGSDGDCVDEQDKRLEAEARVAELIRVAEETATATSTENAKRANQALRSGKSKDSTTAILARVELSMETLQQSMNVLRSSWKGSQAERAGTVNSPGNADSEEERLSLTVSKEDFATMQVVGQFNLGFILAVRRAHREEAIDEADVPHHVADELFIIDQHASDEKFNFERLQAETIVGNQRLVRPGVLDLTAVEEEVVLENLPALEKNGFLIEADCTGARPVGRRCSLISLPLSKEVVFDSRDLDELIHLLAESPPLNEASTVPRPSKVRKMFAMRACRSSIMIGTTLSRKQMSKVLAQMGTIDKPWNCPHGRPTMRHLATLSKIETWQEGDGTADEVDSTSTTSIGSIYRK